MIESQEDIQQRNTLSNMYERIKPLLSAEDEDLKGIREWVTAKRIEEIRKKREDFRRCSLPWQVG